MWKKCVAVRLIHCGREVRISLEFFWQCTGTPRDAGHSALVSFIGHGEKQCGKNTISAVFILVLSVLQSDEMWRKQSAVNWGLFDGLVIIWTNRHIEWLTLVATALFFHVVSRPKVALNLAAQVKCDLAVRRRTPSLLPPTASCRRALNTVSIVMISFNIVSVACQVGN
jgi:hypothetical protein